MIQCHTHAQPHECLIWGRSVFFGRLRAEPRREGSNLFLKKVKEVVDSRKISYNVFNPDGDLNHSNGNVLRQSASSI